MSRSVPSLATGFTAEVLALDDAAWTAELVRFDDANLYQMPSYGRKRWPRSRLEQLVLRRDGEVAALALVRVVRVPLLGGIAYVRWGPVWRQAGRDEDPEVLRQAIRALRSEFVLRRGMVLQVVPRITEDRDDLRQLLEEEGLAFTPSDYNTVLVDISGSEEEIRANLVPRWRTDLNRSQRNELKLTEGDQLALYDRFDPIYREMYDRKNLADFGDLAVYREIQEDLPPDQKMRIMLCAQDGGGDGAGAVTSALGDTGLAVLWATNPEGRDSRGAYFLQWEVIAWLKRQGCQYYDVGGVSREENPGGYRFKCGLIGKKGQGGREVRFVGQFETSPSRLHRSALDLAIRTRERLRDLRRSGQGRGDG